MDGSAVRSAGGSASRLNQDAALVWSTRAFGVSRSGDRAAFMDQLVNQAAGYLITNTRRRW
jgi:hypothetical protein